MSDPIKYALVDGDGNVTDVILADNLFVPPEDRTMVAAGSSLVGPGWTYSGGEFVAPSPTIPSVTWAGIQNQAQQALAASDRVAIRCIKSNIGFPAAWVAYVSQLRAIIRAPSGDPTQSLPSQPPYPAGT